MIKTYLGPICLTLAASIWGGLYVVSKVVLTVIPPLGLVWVRYVLALFALVIAGFATGQSLADSAAGYSTHLLHRSDWILCFHLGTVCRHTALVGTNGLHHYCCHSSLHGDICPHVTPGKNHG